MLYPAIVTSEEELRQILQLQQENHIDIIDEAEIQSQGFVTLRHSLETLEQMHGFAPSVIVKDDGQVIAYALTMLCESRQLVPGLDSMFSLLESLAWDNLPLDHYRFYVMGQVCIAKPYRGRGIFEQLYLHHKEVYRSRFNLLITEISGRNQRSLRAHHRVGFRTIHIHSDKLDEWHIVAWDWN